jgi:hypothetical protein
MLTGPENAETTASSLHDPLANDFGNKFFVFGGLFNPPQLDSVKSHGPHLQQNRQDAPSKTSKCCSERDRVFAHSFAFICPLQRRNPSFNE